MATIYYVQEDPKNPTYLIGGFFESNITPTAANRKVKKLNNNLTDDEKSVGKTYQILQRNYTNEEFNKVIEDEL